MAISEIFVSITQTSCSAMFFSVKSCMFAGDRAFVCLVCRRSFINLVSYTEHHRKVHERQFMHACSACGRGFWKRVDKLRHNCKPQNLCLNQLRNAHLTAKAKATMEKWVGPYYLEMDRREADKITTNKNKGADDKRKQLGLQGRLEILSAGPMHSRHVQSDT